MTGVTFWLTVITVSNAAFVCAARMMMEEKPHYGV